MEISKELEAANAAFYTSLNSMLIGDISPMENLWSHAPDITYLGPAGEVLKGREEIFASWQHLASLKMHGDVHPENMHFFEDGNIGIIQCVEIGTHQIKNKQEKINIRASNIFRKENGKWKMISHQTDLCQVLSQ
jgi:ketosteroid isomerase-like protein